MNITQDPLMTVAELARFLRKSEAWVYRNSRSGVLPTIMVGRSRRFSRRAITGWLSRRSSSQLHDDMHNN
ncbi:MAG: helix-turn-helix domain-containing protein [Coriobacteriia bacterium]|nr:helix-turn-helix domain-containing protein [Coriobacteriia bacterium]